MSIQIRAVLLLSILVSCHHAEERSLSELMQGSPSIEGKEAYLGSPYVTAGNRVYMVGHQDGSFPDLGWHIKGEMGGVWNHPIKLMDGFEIELFDGTDTFKLDKADAFTNYPMANKHSFIWEDRDIEIDRWQFVPDDKQGLVIQLSIKNLGEDRKLKMTFTGITDLRPTWLGEQTDMFDSKDIATYDSERQCWKIKDELNEWYAIFGCQSNAVNGTQGLENPTQDSTSANRIESTLLLNAGQTHLVNYLIAGSYISESDALQSYDDIGSNINADFSAKRERYQVLAEQSKLTIPDKDMQEAFEWLKYNCDWLVRTVPEIGSGMTAGIPDYPWWFGVDSEYALKGYMAIGQRKIVYNTIHLLDSLSKVTNGNGRIVHEVSTNGVVFNKGNVNETPQFSSLIWEIYKWNGDLEFLRKYWPTIKQGLNWLMSEKDANRNLFPDGYGMMEIHGLDSEMIDVAAYTQRAFADAAKIASELADTDLYNQYQQKADMLKERINADFWSEEFGSYGDFIGTDAQALHLIDDAIARAEGLEKPWAVEELENTRAKILRSPSDTPRPFVLHHNWVVNTPMEMQIASKAKALRALETAEKFVNPFGVFVTGIDRDASAGSDDGSFQGTKVFSYTGAVMTLPTGVQAVAENNYGRPNKALNYLKRMTRTFSFAFPGSIYEVSPDYGMITQAWNIYGFAIPIIQQFFGIDPVAAQKKVIIRPQMPDEWDVASLENVRIAEQEISLHYERSDGFVKMIVEQKLPGWDLEIIMPEKKGDVTFKVIESSVSPERSENQFIFHSQKLLLEVILQENS